MIVFMSRGLAVLNPYDGCSFPRQCVSPINKEKGEK